MDEDGVPAEISGDELKRLEGWPEGGEEQSGGKEEGNAIEKRPTQASGDDGSLPFHVVPSRKTAPAISRDQDAIVASGISFSGKGGSGRAEERISGPTPTPYTQREGETHMVTGVSESATGVFPQYIVEARAQINGILKENCQPPVLALLVTNDNNAKHRQPEATSLNNITLPSDRPPLLNAEKSCSTIKTALEDSGIVVIPVTNRPKEYLLAVLTVLTTMDIPKSCELFWFLFTGHGSRGAFCVNGEDVPFEELIQEASQIRIKYMAFFFECCQLHNEDKIKAAEIKKQYVAVYSSPPNQVSYYYNGVGLMMIVLAKLLRKGYSGSFSELQRLVRQKLVNKMTKVLGIHEDMKELFIAHHLPVHTSTMYDDFSFQRKISFAMRPVISTQVDHTAVISVYNPERILCHPSNSKFELVKDMLELRVGDQQERVCLAVEDASFGVTVVMKVTLPPQIQQTSGELWVGCQYGDSRVEYCKPISVDLPCHGLPVIRMCTLEENQCEVAVAYEPNIVHPENDYYHVESVEIGYHDSSHSWCPLYHQDGYDFSQNVLVVLPPSHDPVKRELQVALKYLKCPTPVFSKPYAVDQEPISTPKITGAVPNRDDFTSTLTVRPELPSLHKQSDLYVPKGYTVWSHVGSRSKVIAKKELKQGEKLEEEETVVVPLRLVRKNQITSVKYVVAMNYNGISDVRSEEYPVEAGAIESPVITSITLNGSNTADFKFIPNQPKLPSHLLSDSDPDEYRVSRFDIYSHVVHRDWVRLTTKEVDDGFLDAEESITIPLHLRSGGRHCYFKVTLHYSNAGDVESEEFSMECPLIAKPISVPHDVSLSYESWHSSSATVTWKHDYTPPPDTSIASGLRYGVFKDDKPDEDLLESVLIDTRSVKIPVGCGPIRVGMFYSDHHELGTVYSDSVKGDCRLYRGWKKLPCFLKAYFPIQLFLMIALMAAFSAPPLVCTHAHGLQLVVAGDTTSYDPGWRARHFCKYLSIEMTVNKFVDNKDLNVTVFTIDNSDVRTDNVTETSKKYNGGKNQTFFAGRDIVPTNYFNHPQNLHKGSVIDLHSRIYLDSGGDLDTPINITYFKSREHAIDFLDGGSDEMAVHRVNITNCTHHSCNDSYFVEDDLEAFYFFVISSDIDAAIQAITDFIFYVIRYTNNYTDPNVKEVVHINVNKSGSVSLDPSSVILVYGHPPNDSSARDIGHLTFTAHTGYSRLLPLALVLVTSVLNVVWLIAGSLYIIYMCRRHTDQIQHEPANPDENTPLLAPIN